MQAKFLYIICEYADSLNLTFFFKFGKITNNIFGKNRHKFWQNEIQIYYSQYKAI